MLRIAVLGATGRMGTAVMRLVAEAEQARIAGAATEPGHAAIGSDPGAWLGLEPLGVAITADPAVAVAEADVAIDFSAPAAASKHLEACAAAGCGLVLGTTGLDTEARGALERAARKIPVVYARNMSLGVAVATELVRLAARLLGPEYDVEISEAHHRHKQDAPSGTALQLGEAVAGERGARLEDLGVFARERAGPARAPGTIGFSVVRGGGIVGEHRVLFAGDEELLEVRHQATDRALFARGALRAARWVAGRSPGCYGMRDVLGVSGPAAAP